MIFLKNRKNQEPYSKNLIKDPDVGSLKVPTMGPNPTLFLGNADSEWE
jgi:hypothetical protein